MRLITAAHSDTHGRTRRGMDTIEIMIQRVSQLGDESDMNEARRPSSAFTRLFVLVVQHCAQPPAGRAGIYSSGGLGLTSECEKAAESVLARVGDVEETVVVLVLFVDGGHECRCGAHTHKFAC